MSKEIVLRKKTLTGITKWLNETFKLKKSGKPFLLNDVQNYVKRGQLPTYLGGHEIVADNSIEDVKLYKIIKNEV